MSGILIKVKPEVFTVEFESTKAPCSSCLFYKPDLDGDGYTACTMANKQLSSAVLTQCEKENWRRDKV